MAASGYTPIQLYHSTTASAVPVNTNLVNGELAINIADGKLYYKDSGGTVQVIATKGAGTIGGSNTQVQYNSSGSLAGSANFTFNGTTATINTLNLTNALGAAYGGTAQSTYTQGDLLYASAANTLAKLAIGSNTYILTSNGTIPGWSAPSAVSVNTATNLAGGAGGSVPYQSGAGATTFLSIGTANQVMTSSGSLPQWSSGLSITTLTASDAVTFSATTQNIALGTSQTTGTFTVGGAAQTGTQTFDQSTKTHTLNLGTGATENALTKTINIGTAGVSGSTTAITIGSTNGTSTTLNGTVTAATFNSTTIDTTNIEVTNIKAKDGTAALSIADSTGVVSVSANPVLSGGTANGVLYLNASKAATSGTALVFDGSNLGIGTSPNTKLNLYTASGNNRVRIQSGSQETYLGTDGTNAALSWFNGALTIGTSSNNGAITAELVRVTNGGQVNIGGNFTSTNNTLQVTGNAAIGYTTAAPTTGLIVAGNVGVGTNNPGYKLDVSGQARALEGGTGSGDGSIIAATSAHNGNAGVLFQTNSASRWNLTTQGTNGANLRFYNYALASTVATFDSSGNLGLGVTPSAWGTSSQKAIEVILGALSYRGAGNTESTVTHGAYYDGTNWKYSATSVGAARYQMTGANAGSTHTWSVAAGGTKDNNISFSTAMTLDASGRLGLGGVTNPSVTLDIGGTSGTLIRVGTGTGNGSTNFWPVIVGDGSSAGGGSNQTFVRLGRFSNGAAGIDAFEGGVGNAALAFGTYETERARITSGGDLVVGDTSTSYRLKARADSAAGANQDVLQIYNGASSTATASLVFGTGAYAATCRISGATTGANNGALVFGTDGGSGITERARITSIGGFETRPAASGHAVFNEDGVDADFRVESDTDTHCLFVDASTDRVGIGTATPGAKLEVQAASPSIYLRATTTTGTTIGDKNNRLVLLSDSSTANNGGEIVFAATDTNVDRWAAISGAIQNNGVDGCTGDILFATKGTTTATTLTERARITSGGSVGIGTTTINRKFVVGGDAGTSIIAVQDANSGYTATDGLQLQLASGGDGYLWNYENAAWIFGTNNAERARITSGGYFKASNNGTYVNATATYHELVSNSNGDFGAWVRNTNATSPYGMAVDFSGASPNNGTNVFIRCGDSTAVRFYMYSNGGLANYQANDSNLSDQRVKKDIVAAPSYWDKIKDIEIVHFKYKDQTHDDNNVGVIAQQVEQVAPEFVNNEGWGETPEDGVPLKSIYTSDMYHAAIKALQEAMARIEKLEAEVAALKGV